MLVFVCVCVFMFACMQHGYDVCTCMASMWKSRIIWLALSFSYVGLRNRTLVVKLGGTCLYRWGHLAGLALKRFLWVLGAQTQVFMFVQQTLCLLNYIPIPFLPVPLLPAWDSMGQSG